MKYISIFLGLMLITDVFALSVNDEIRFNHLTQEIRCLVCQNQNIADSNAPLASDLRKKIHHMIIEKKSDHEIKEYLVSRYGEYILLKPRLIRMTFLLWFFPIFGLCAAYCLLAQFFKSHKPTTYGKITK